MRRGDESMAWAKEVPLDVADLNTANRWAVVVRAGESSLGDHLILRWAPRSIGWTRKVRFRCYWSTAVGRCMNVPTVTVTGALPRSPR